MLYLCHRFCQIMLGETMIWIIRFIASFACFLDATLPIRWPVRPSVRFRSYSPKMSKNGRYGLGMIRTPKCSEVIDQIQIYFILTHTQTKSARRHIEEKIIKNKVCTLYNDIKCTKWGEFLKSSQTKENRMQAIKDSFIWVRASEKPIINPICQLIIIRLLLYSSLLTLKPFNWVNSSSPPPSKFQTWPNVCHISQISFHMHTSSKWLPI